MIFDTFRNMIYEKIGVLLKEGRQSLLHARISKRMRVLGITDYRRYLSYVLDDDNREELAHFLNAITTNVSGFFREPDHFVFLSRIVADGYNSEIRRFRIWSAGCATGEEPYSIAMTIQETLKDERAHVSILATDVSGRALSIAMKGVYREEKVRPVRRSLRSRYFDRCLGTGEKDDHCLKVKPFLRRMVSFQQHNLSILPYPISGSMDIIFCRNVMIYFDEGLRQKITGEIHRLLRPGGHLIMGHVESIQGQTNPLHLVRPSIYVKPIGRR